MVTTVDDVSDIQAYYDALWEQEDARLVRHQLEFDLTWRYLDAYLPPQGPILELGAASGAYTIGLARRGYELVAVDFSQRLTALRQRKLQEAGLAAQVHHVVADARHLAMFAPARFSAVLIMGPLYHLVRKPDRQRVLAQAHALLQPGGILMTAFISRYGILGDLMRSVPAWIEQEAEVRSVLERGRDPDDWPRAGFRGYFATVEELCPLHENAGFQSLVLAAVEPAISADDLAYNQLSGNRRQAWLDLLFRVSTEPSIRGASRHLLYIGQKSDQSHF